MKKYLFRITSIMVCFFTLAIYTNSFAADLGDVILSNVNESQMNNDDSLQFQLVTNGGGLVESAALAAIFPDNMQTLDKWDFSDQTNQFTVYLRDVSKHQINFHPCSNIIQYSADHAPIAIEGWTDGIHFGCHIHNL